MSLSVAVITPTIGKSTLIDALNSVASQSYQSKHYIFADGRDSFETVDEVVENAAQSERSIIKVPDNIGKGFYGHRVYAASPFLVNEEVIFFLDEDNWLEANHVESLLRTLTREDTGWAYSLRKIYDKSGNFICEDNCESLGKWHSLYNPSVYHVDTSCYAVRRDLLLKTSFAWYGGWGADRQFFAHLLKTGATFATSGKYSLCYRLGGNEASVTKEFFMEGNKRASLLYPGKKPWQR